MKRAVSRVYRKKNLVNSEQLKWKEYYIYANKTMDESIETFKKQDEKVNSLLLFHSLFILLLTILIQSVFKNVILHDPLNPNGILFILFLALSFDLLCIIELLQAISYKKALLNNTNQKIMARYWNENNLTRIYNVRGNDALNCASYNQDSIRKKIDSIKQAIFYSKVTIMLICSVIVMIIIQLGGRNAI